MGLTSNAKLGPYDIRLTLGAGGRVKYIARVTLLGRDAAVKVLLRN
jgi:hypothetical protein